MHVVFLNQFFWPDGAPTSVLLTDLVRDLAQRGHRITVICASASYVAADGVDAPPDAKVIRIQTLPFGRGKLARIASYAPFYIGATFWSMMIRKPDVVVSMTTPPLLSVLGGIVKQFRGSRHFIWEMDVYPDVMVDLQVMRAGAWPARFIGWLADASRTHADGLIALGECMKQRLMGRGISGSKIFTAHNWADGSVVPPVRNRNPGRPLVIIYAGNLGMAHDVDTAVEAISSLSNKERFRFVFAGAGPHLDRLRQICRERNLSCVEFLPFGTREELKARYASADIGLVTLKDQCRGSLVPSKVYSLLAAGLPILYVGPRMATPGLLIEEHGCGWQVDGGDYESLHGLLDQLACARDSVARKSAIARVVFLSHFDRPLATMRLAGILGLLNNSPRQARNDAVSAEERREKQPS